MALSGARGLERAGAEAIYDQGKDVGSAQPKPKFRPRRKVLLVRSGGRFRGSSLPLADRAPATRKRVKR